MTTVPSPPPVPSFLGLPPELRNLVYEVMLELPVNDHLSLLCVCRQIFNEGKDMFFRRPLNCDSQDALSTFTMTYSPKTVQSVTNLIVRFREVDPSVMQPALALLVAGLPISASQHPRLQLLSNVKYLSILRPAENTRNSPSRDFFLIILSSIQKNYTHLEGLRLMIDNVSLSFMASLQNLRSLHFSGFSNTSPQEMLSIVKQFVVLDHLTIVGPPPGRRRSERYGYHHRTVVQTFTGDLLYGMRPLKSLAIYETADSPLDEPAFFTKDIFVAIYLGHRDSLRELHLISEKSQDPADLSVLSAFLLSTKTLRKLTIGWPSLDVAFLDNLPTCLEHLDVSVADPAAGQAALARLMQSEDRLTNLRCIRFNLMSDGGHSDPPSNMSTIENGPRFFRDSG